jgi:hypothetical protein
MFPLTESKTSIVRPLRRDWRMLVTLPIAGIAQSCTAPIPDASLASAWVESTSRVVLTPLEASSSDESTCRGGALVRCDGQKQPQARALTPHTPATSPYISTPASAKAVLATVAPAATQPTSGASASKMLMNTSIDAFGRRSSRSEGRSASWIECDRLEDSASLPGRRRTSQEKGEYRTSTLSSAFPLYFLPRICLGPYTAQAIFRLPVSM